MSNSPLIGIHLGTASVQVDVYDRDGDRLEAGQAPISEQTTVAWERALREAMPTFSGRGGMCSVASTSGTAVLVDEYGEPVFQPLMYHDSLTTQPPEIADLQRSNDIGGRDIALVPTSPLPKILALRESDPVRFEEVEWILCPATWLLYRLRTGSSGRWDDIETDWSNALKFGADIRPSLPDWRDGLFEDLGLSRSLFPSIRPPGSFVGTATSEIADRTDLDGARLFQGLTDGSASVLANGCLEPGDFSLTFGAASVVKYISEDISPHDALYYHRHPIDGYLPGAAFDSGNVLRWAFTRVLDCTPEWGIELAQSIPAGQEYEVFLQGSRSPFFDTNIGGSILGLANDSQLSTDEVQGRIARGLTTGIVLTEWTYISLIEQHFDASIDSVRLINDDAPSLRDDHYWWNELRASVWNRPIEEMEPRTTAGLLVPPTIINSIYRDAEEAVDNLTRKRATIDPPSDSGGEYETQKREYFDRWSQVADLYDHRN